MKESILISMIFIFLYIFLFVNKKDKLYIETNTGTKYMVHEDELKNEKAELLSRIVENMFVLKNHLVKNKGNFAEYTEYINQLEENFSDNRTTVYETDPSSDLTSYSVNKGEEVSFCLKSKKDGKLHTLNLMMYVAIHEMAHMACPEIGHGTLFRKIFKRFTEEAMSLGLYRKEDYGEKPIEYCGMVLSSSIV